MKHFNESKNFSQIEDLIFEENSFQEIKPDISLSCINKYDIDSIESSNSEEENICDFKSNILIFPENKLKEIKKLNNNQSKIKKNFKPVSFLNKYYKLTDLIEKHLTLEKFNKHPLNNLRKIYLEYFNNQYNTLLNNKIRLNNEELNQQIKKMFNDLNTFITIYSECILLFYNFEEFSSELNYLFTIENMKNFGTCIFFSNEDLYKLILNGQKKIDLINKFSLKKKYRKLNSKEKYSKDFNLDFQLQKINYSNSSEFLKNITKLNSPVHKFKIIMQLWKSIKEDLSDNNQMCEKNYLNEINSDDLIVIFEIIINNSKINSIISHCNLIERFVHLDTLKCFQHYSFFTFRACVEHFQDKF